MKGKVLQFSPCTRYATVLRISPLALQEGGKMRYPGNKVARYDVAHPIPLFMSQ